LARGQGGLRYPLGPMTLAPGLARGEDGVVRCFWAGGDPLYTRYHDEEWGFPVADDRRLFEKICLEGFQSGLSWLTILREAREFFAPPSDGSISTRSPASARATSRDC